MGIDMDITKIGDQLRERLSTGFAAVQRQVLIAAGCVFLVLLTDPRIGYTLSDAQKLVAEAWRIVDQSYVDRTFNNHDWFKERQRAVKKVYADVDDGYDEIRKLLGLLEDPYTRVLTPSQHNALRTTTTGVLEGGIGLVLTSTTDNNVVVASTPDADTPAGKNTKLKAGDIIVRVDGEEISGLTAEEVAQRIRGNPGTDVLLTVRPLTAAPTNGAYTEYTANIKRAVLQLRTVYATEDENTHLGVIRVKSFNEHTADDVRKALTHELRDSSEIVLDLRGNPGGAFEGGVDVARMFLHSGEPIVYVVDRNGVTDEIDALEDGIVPDVPLYVLVDSGTASASEILAGALLDNGRATVIGEKTFGKAVVQTVTPLSDGGAVAVTIAKYETPNRININKKGIVPNIEGTCAQDVAVVTCLPRDFQVAK